jgi:hypothetical protein
MRALALTVLLVFAAAASGCGFIPVLVCPVVDPHNCN